MSWIKRNLLFVVLGVIAIALMGAAGWYCYSKWQLDKESWDNLSKAYDELRGIGQQKPNPGNKNVDNVKIARDQQKEVGAEMQRLNRYFAPIPAIPDTPNASDQDFATGLRQTITQLQRDAAGSGVTLQPDYSFSFSAQKRLVKFTPGTPPVLARQLGEIKIICDVLFAAKVNSIDNLRRERVGEDDNQGSIADYLDEKSVTNELAVVTPYEITFRCFSGELAGVLSGLANQPHGFVVRSINVEQPNATTSAAAFSAGTMPGNVPAGGSMIGGVRYDVTGSPIMPGMPVPGMNPTPGAPAPTPGMAPVQRRGGLPIVLDEKQVRVTMVVVVIKVLPTKS